jgi:hypothetical protein
LLEITKKSAKSDVFYGLKGFIYRAATGAGDAGGFFYLPTSTTDILIRFQIDDQFDNFNYQGLLINHFNCIYGDHYIYGLNGSNYECFDGCQVA